MNAPNISQGKSQSHVLCTIFSQNQIIIDPTLHTVTPPTYTLSANNYSCARANVSVCLQKYEKITLHICGVTFFCVVRSRVSQDIEHPLMSTCSGYFPHLQSTFDYKGQ